MKKRKWSIEYDNVPVRRSFHRQPKKTQEKPAIYLTGDDPRQVAWYRIKFCLEMDVDYFNKCLIDPCKLNTVDRYKLVDQEDNVDQFGNYCVFDNDDSSEFCDMAGKNFWSHSIRYEKCTVDGEPKTKLQLALESLRKTITIPDADAVSSATGQVNNLPAEYSTQNEHSWEMLTTYGGYTDIRRPSVQPNAQRRWALIVKICAGISLNGIYTIDNLLNNCALNGDEYGNPVALIFTFPHVMDRNTMQVYYMLMHKQYRQQVDYQKCYLGAKWPFLVTDAYLERRLREMNALVRQFQKLLPPYPLTPPNNVSKLTTLHWYGKIFTSPEHPSPPSRSSPSTDIIDRKVHGQ